MVGVYSCTVKYKVNAGSVSYMKETKYTAKDANGDINPADIQAKVSELTSIVNSLNGSLSGKFAQAESDASKAIVVEGKTYQNIVYSRSSEVSNSLNGISNTANNVVSMAMKAHDELQKRYNREERDKAKSVGEIIEEVNAIF